MTKKILIASGCSFTFESWNWPTFVQKSFDLDLINVAMASQGNGLIAKKTIYTVNKLLQTRQPEDLIVGIMWSGIDRFEFYSQDINKIENIDGWTQNPTNVIDDNNNKKWVILTYYWKYLPSQLWYQNFHSDIGSMINTIQYILYTQWFLEKNNIFYFMTTFMDIFGTEERIITHPEVNYLYKMINFDTFIPIKGCYEWVKENHEKGGLNPPDKNGNIGYHPTEFGHQMFAKEVIEPFLSNKLPKAKIKYI